MVLGCKPNASSDGMYIYLIESDSKTTNYIKSFNLCKECNYSHICIVFEVNGVFESFEALPLISSNCIVRTNKNEFNKKYKDNISEIWKYKFKDNDLTIKEIRDVFFYDFYNNEQFKYDYKFDLKTHNKLYCSEFIFIGLNNYCNIEFDNYINSVKLEDDFLVNYFKSDSLKYIPIDFFKENDNFSKIK